MARCDVVLLASSVWRLAPQESVQRTVGSVKGAEGAELKESARERTAVKPPNPVDGPEHACGVLLGTRGEPSPKPRDPRQRPWGSTLRALRQGGQRLGRWCDGQRTKEQRGARTPAHAKVGGVTVLAGLACSRFSRFIRPIPLRPLGWVRCPSLAQRKREHAAGGVLRGGCRAAPCWRVSEPWNRTAAESVAGGTE